ncbi:MAG: Cellulosome-anchoring protein precursor [Pelotomaculum sp. PtaU1.Bin035]|nr:MAG: Cellulosome-anchoring protein precursor [Pelotomaculum sp. PtaU1.Bin035]
MLKKKNIFFTVVLLICLSTNWISPAGASPAGSDIENHWAEKAIEMVLDLGIAGGYPEEFFLPEQPVTRAEFVKMIVAAGWVLPAISGAGQTYKDVGREHWAYPFVEAAVAAGIVKASEDPERYFEPDRAIARGEMAAMAGRLLACTRQPEIAAEGGLSNNWPALMLGSGIFYGYPDGTFGEGNSSTRAEACAVILRLKDRLLAVEAEREREWISTTQSPEGYFALSGGRTDVIPYFCNLTGMALCGDPQSLDRVKRYLDWNFSRLNYPDRWGLNGTIYDYRQEGDLLVSVDRYDSADSYAATLLTLAADYQASSNDLSFIREHYRELSSVEELIITLQDSDGLIWAKTDLKIKYLMDNCECYRGLKNWARVLDVLEYKELSALCDQKAEMIKTGIIEQFWDEDKSCFAWAVDQAGIKHYPVPGQSYPGIFAQIYPVTFGVIPPASEIAVQAYQKLNNELPSWPGLEVGDPFPWAILGYAAAVMSDLPRAGVFLKNCRTTYIGSGRGFPWSSFEGAFYARACDSIRNRIKDGLR